MATMSDAMKVKLETVKRKQKYKELIERGTVISEKLENQDVLETFNNIMEIVVAQEELAQSYVKEGRVENAADYLIDAQILKMSHDLMGSTADKMGNSDFSEDEFINSLINVLTLDLGYQNFDQFGDYAVKCCKTFSLSLPMLGTFDFEAAPRQEKPKKERQARAKQQVGAVKAPENVKQMQKTEKGAERINKVRAEIQRVCRERKTDVLPYYELISHPQCFMKSVDIAFQISFLIRDGFLGLRSDDDEPFIFLYDPDPTQSNQSNQPNSSETVQCVMVFNPMIWREKVKKYKVHVPLLKLDGNETEAGADVSMEEDSDSD